MVTGIRPNNRFSLGVRGKGGEREIKKSKRERERKKRNKGGGFDYCGKSPKKGNFKPLFSAEGQRGMTRVSAGAKIVSYSPFSHLPLYTLSSPQILKTIN